MGDGEHFITTDRDSVLVLLTANLPIIKTDIEKKYNKIRFYFDAKTADPIMEAYKKKESQPFEMADFLRALRLFNSVVHSR